MKKKCWILSLCSFAAALAIFAFTYCMYHYLGPDGRFGAVYRTEPVKPFVTLLLGIWGTVHHAVAVTSLLVGAIFFGKKKTKGSQSL